MIRRIVVGSTLRVRCCVWLTTCGYRPHGRTLSSNARAISLRRPTFAAWRRRLAAFRGLYCAERELAGVGMHEYYARLRQSLIEAEAVLVLNPVIAAMIEPYASRVPADSAVGMDSARFPVADSGR